MKKIIILLLTLFLVLFSGCTGDIYYFGLQTDNNSNLQIGSNTTYSGITLYNQTGSPYCVKITGSLLLATSGSC